MVVRVSVGVDDGTPVVRRSADGPDGEHLRRVAAVLEQAQGTGVIRLVASGERDGGWELVTEHGGPSLAAAPPRSVAELVVVGSELAGTLARLHEHGVVHGRLTAGRILRGRDGRLLVRGFAPVPGADDPAADPADDVAALAGVLADVLDQLGPPVPRERSLVDSVRTVLIRASAARRLAADLHALAEEPGRSTPRGTGRALLAAAAVVLVLLSLGLLGHRSAGRAPRVGTATTTHPHPPPTSTSTPGPGACVATAARAMRAATCAHDVEVDHGVVVLDGERFVVGLADDEVAVADWDCAEGLRAAVLRPSTGEVRVFAPFVPGAGAVVEQAERVDGATSLGVEVVDGCPSLGTLAG